VQECHSTLLDLDISAMNIFKNLQAILNEDVKYTKFNIHFASWSGVIGHPLYWVCWTYYFNESDNPWLRFSAALLCLGSAFHDKWPTKLQRFFPFYWVLVMTYSLPFLFTYTILANNFELIWLLSHFGMLFYLILLMPSVAWFFIMLISGSVLGITAHWLIAKDINLVNLPLSYIPIFIFILFTCLGFLRASRQSIMNAILERQKSHHLKSLAGSIAHEMRNPLSQIYGSLHMLERQLPQLNNNEYTKIVHKVIQSSFQLIDLTMDAINEKPINKENFKIISAQQLMTDVLQEYAYADVEQKHKVSVRGGDFGFLADPVLVKYVLFNLIGNALYYVKVLPDAEIVISVLPNTRQIEVRDTGPGIAPEAIPKLFDSFYTSGKQAGTGLGLAYCKRTMKALGGNIYCRSELGKYTAFVLTFPKVSKEFKSIFGTQVV
jgi:two-component system CAI-1 autoinducer sensor kinase/phosphatase CqsS